jgi:hypothetical protein
LGTISKSAAEHHEGFTFDNSAKLFHQFHTDFEHSKKKISRGLYQPLFSLRKHSLDGQKMGRDVSQQGENLHNAHPREKAASSRIDTGFYSKAPDGLLTYSIPRELRRPWQLAYTLLKYAYSRTLMSDHDAIMTETVLRKMRDNCILNEISKCSLYLAGCFFAISSCSSISVASQG